MDESTLKAIVAAKVAAAAGGGELDSDQSAARRNALKYYRGDKRGDEIEGRSQVISRDVADAVDAIMPSLIKVFTAGPEIAVFEPVGPEDESAAAQATDYVNWIFGQQNNGFMLLHTWFKDALLNRLGVVESWWDEAEENVRESYDGLTDDEFGLLQADEDVEIVEHAEMDSAEGLPAHHAVVRRRREAGRVMIAAVPGDEFLYERDAVSLDDVKFCGRRKPTTVADLIAAGFDEKKVRAIPTGSQTQISAERQERFGEENVLPADDGGELDPLMREVEVTQAYLQVDFDGDGKPEWRKVTCAGSGYDILANDEIDGHPFSGLTPVPMPHTLVGESMADKTSDLQDVKTALWRQSLDNLYIANNRRVMVVEGRANLDDLLVSRPGGVIRVKEQGAVAPMDFMPIGADAYQMIEYIDAVREQRTGVTRYNQGLDADSLNKTATGIRMIANAGEQRTELIARVFAETGVKSLFRRILELVQKHQQAPRAIKLRNKWVTMDPRGWNTRMDMTVSVGLGSGSKDQQMQSVMAMLGIDAQLIQLQGGASGPVLTMTNIYNKLKKLVEAAGLKHVEPYYSDPLAAPQPGQPQQPPPPDPAMIAAQAKIAEAQAKMQADAQAAQQKMALAQQAAQQQAAQDQAKAAAELEAARAKALNDIEIARAKAAADIEIARMKAGDDRARTESEIASTQAADKAQVATQEAIDRLGQQLALLADAQTAVMKAVMSPKSKTAKAVRQSDGSYVLESIERPAQLN